MSWLLTKIYWENRQNFLTRVEEHGTHSKDQDTVVYKHMQSCIPYFDMISLYNVNVLRSTDSPNLTQHIYHSVRNNTGLLAQNDHWDQLCYLESLHIKRSSPTLNCGIKATKELALFT